MKAARLAFAFAVALAALALPAAARKVAPPSAPVARRVDVVSTLHGDERHDEYKWLEQRDDAAVVAYLEAENAYAAAVMKPQAKLVARLEAEMRARVVEDDVEVPVRRGAWDYFRVHEQGKAYPIYKRRWLQADDAVERVTLDLNALAEGKPYVDLGVYELSDDGRYLAYSIDDTGDENYTLYVKDLDTGTLGSEKLARVADAAWSQDGKTLLYTVRDDGYRAYALYCHTRGADVAQDRLLYEEKDPSFEVSIDRTRSGEWLVLYSLSYETSEVRVARADRPGGPWQLVAARRPGHMYDLDHGGDTFYIRTNLDAPSFRVVSAPEDDPRPARWKELVPARPDVYIGSADAFAGHLVLLERDGGRPYVTLYDVKTGASVRPAVPDVTWGILPEDNPAFDAGVFRYALTTFERPAAVVEADLASGTLRTLAQPVVPGGHDPAAYVSEWRSVKAADGADIPVSLVYRKRGAAGPRPLLLEAYGAYGEPLDPEWNPALASLLDRGFVYAIAHVRGGGERGEAWHDAGKRGNRLVAAADFVAVAEELIRSKRTTPAQLALTGLSGGGLLMGIVLNLRPELFRVALLRVPFVTAVDTMLDVDAPLTTTEYEEWGDPRDPKQYAYMKAFDPYSNLRAQAYPAVLVESSFDDGRVRYFEQAKYVARLRARKTDARPVLLRTSMHAGHGGASGRYAPLASFAFAYAFLLGML